VRPCRAYLDIYSHLEFGGWQNLFSWSSNSLSAPTTFFKDFEMDGFWKYSLALAVTSKNIAQKSGLEPPDDHPTSNVEYGITLLSLFYNRQYTLFDVGR
jgi:hypothetical protein